MGLGRCLKKGENSWNEFVGLLFIIYYDMQKQAI